MCKEFRQKKTAVTLMGSVIPAVSMNHPFANLTRFHGVFAPNSAHRAQVTPAKRGKGNKVRTADAPEDTTPAERRAAMTFS